MVRAACYGTNVIREILGANFMVQCPPKELIMSRPQKVEKAGNTDSELDAAKTSLASCLGELSKARGALEVAEAEIAELKSVIEVVGASDGEAS